MARLGKILVPVDGSAHSKRGVKEAVDIAKATGASVVGYYVFQLPFAAGTKYTDKMKKDAEQKAVKAIGPAMREAKKAGVSFQYKTGGGNVGEEIVKYAKKGKFDMIVIGARGLSGVKEKFLGSVSNHVVHSSKVPVMVIK